MNFCIIPIVYSNVQWRGSPGGGGHCLFEGRYPLPNYCPCFSTSSFKKENIYFPWQKYLLPLESGNLKLVQTKFPAFSLCFGNISKFPVFSLTGNFFLPFSLCSGYPACLFFNILLKPNLGRYPFPRLSTPPLLSLPFKWVVGGGGGYGEGGWSGWKSGRGGALPL